jgi:hypothetical protein
VSTTYPTEGGCLCGAIRFRLLGPPYAVDFCHCHSCRKHSGAPASVFADCKRDVVELIKGEVTRHCSSPGVLRGFCGTCGSVLTYENEKLPDEIHIYIGALDHPEDFPPNAKPSFPEERVSWFHAQGDS